MDTAEATTKYNYRGFLVKVEVKKSLDGWERVYQFCQGPLRDTVSEDFWNKMSQKNQTTQVPFREESVDVVRSPTYHQTLDCYFSLQETPNSVDNQSFFSRLFDSEEQRSLSTVIRETTEQIKRQIDTYIEESNADIFADEVFYGLERAAIQEYGGLKKDTVDIKRDGQSHESTIVSIEERLEFSE